MDSQIQLAKYNFLSNFKDQVSYEEFLEKFKASPKHATLKEDSPDLNAALLEDIKIPGFYKKLEAFHHLELMQGSNFVDKPHYDSKEQIMCAIDGQVMVALVPPTQRQEVYPSLLNQSVYWDQYLSKNA